MIKRKEVDIIETESKFINNLLHQITDKVIEHEYKFLPLQYKCLKSRGQLQKYVRDYSCSINWKIETYIVNNKHKYRTIFRNACNDNLCNICNWQKAKKNKVLIANTIMDAVYRHKYKIIFLRLSNTAIDCHGLNNSLKGLQKACNTLLNNRLVKKNIKGYIKKLEITYNKDTNKYNPHYHIILIVNKDYFKNNFINHIIWLNLWRRYTKNPNANIYVQNRINIKGNNIYAFSNYISKPIIKYKSPINQEVFDVLHTCLLGKTILKFAGICKQGASNFKQHCH